MSLRRAGIESLRSSGIVPGAGVALAVSRRSGNLTGFLVCAALLAYAYYLQYAKGLEPCPLCILQRLAFFALAMAFLLAAVHRAGRIGAKVRPALRGTKYHGKLISTPRGRRGKCQAAPPSIRNR